MLVLFGVLVGAAMPVQTSVNTRLRQSVGAPWSASMYSFLVGTVALFLAVLLIDGSLPQPEGLPAWMFAGGLLGTVVLTGNIFLYPRLGAVQTVVFPVTGQVLMGLAIDHFGWFGTGQVALNATRLIGALLVLVGVMGAAGVGRGPGASTHNAWLWRGLGVVFGALSAMQTAINGALGTELGSALQSALISFTVGALTLVLIVLLTRSPVVPDAVGPWWKWTGGLLGATFVAGNAFLAPILGTGVTVMVTQLGLMSTSLLIDRFGFLGTPPRGVSVVQVAGLVLMLSGVALIRLM